MASNEDLEKRIEYLEKEVKHLKAVLQYQMRGGRGNETLTTCIAILTTIDSRSKIVH